MRAAAQVTPLPLAGARVEVVIDGEFGSADLHNLRVVGGALVVDQFELVRLGGQFGARLVLGGVDAAGEALPRLDDLLHLPLQGHQILGGEGFGDVEVVVEAVGDGRSDAEAGVGKHVLHGLSQDVGARMADHLAAVVGVRGNRLDVDVDLRCPRQILQVALRISDDDHRLRAPVGQVVLAERGTRGGPSRHTDRGGAGHQNIIGHGGFSSIRETAGLPRDRIVAGSFACHSSPGARDTGFPERRISNLSRYLAISPNISLTHVSIFVIIRPPVRGICTKRSTGARVF